MLNNYLKLIFAISLFTYFFYISNDTLSQSPIFYMFLFITSILLVSVVVFFAFKSETLAKNLVNKGVDLAQANKSEEAIKVFDRVIKNFAKSKKINILEKVADAFINKASILEQLNRNEESIKISEELKTWANSFEEKEIKTRLLKYINIFKNHKKNKI